jgi:hypothetical protein
MANEQVVSVLMVGDKSGDSATFYRARTDRPSGMISRGYVKLTNTSIIRLADLLRRKIEAGEWECRPALLWCVGYRATRKDADRRFIC